jgi:serine phosphatase RsbU (regulator of sigma subunit)
MGSAIQSEAFQLAALRSERIRIVAMIGIACVILSLNIVHAIVDPEPGDRAWLWFVVPLVGSFVIYQGMMFWITTRALRVRRAVRGWIWVLNTIVETSLPTAALMGMSMWEGHLGPYRALVSPAVVVYCLFIVLSTLRLSPALSLLAGAVSAAGYLLVFAWTTRTFPDARASRVLSTDMFFIFPFALFMCGMVSAYVARQIRGHVVAALTEAQTKQKLEMIEHDLQIARSIQMGLLPKTPPRVSGYDIAGWSQPADQTGGDYYDWLELPGGRVIVTIADASGHGIGPALLIAACRAYFRAIAAHDDPLERICAQVDALIAKDVEGAGRFITAAVALLEPDENRLGLYSAGHAPLYLYVAASDEVKSFDADQPPLGINLAYDGNGDTRARIIALAPGDALVLVTDGLFECMNGAGEQLGPRRLAESIRRHHASRADAMIRELHDDVCAFSNGQPQSDDRTAVVIRRDSAAAGG